MPVICPTCQILKAAGDVPPTLLFKSLNRRRGVPCRTRACRPDWRLRTHLSDRLLLRSRSGLRGMSRPRSRSGAPHSPGTGDRRSCGISDECTCHCADRSKDDGPRHRAKSGTSGPLLGSCLERDERCCNQCGNERFIHRNFPGPSATHRTAKMRRHKGNVVAAQRPIESIRSEKARGRFPGAGSDILAMMKICR